jgi:peptide/nickel transport system ATP-binding protein
MHKDKHELVAIDGQIPPLHALPQGCVFAPRCSIVEDICHQERPPLEHPAPARSVRCHRWQAIASGEVTLRTKALSASITDREPSETTLRLSELQVSYDVAQTSLGSSNRVKQPLVAVDHVSLDLKGRSTLGIVGESGSGKSSLALAVMGLLDDVDGEMVLFNVQLPPNIRQRDKTILRRLQMVFQQLDEALPPNLTIEEILSRPLINLEGMDKAAARNRAAELLQMVRLPSAYSQRYPRQLSGGEKQRVAIAQAIATSPDLLLTDEPVSALDVSVQANILNLLNDLQKEQGTANLLISHDIAVVTYLADDIAVMYLGQVMQLSPAQLLLTPPYHPYTEALLSAIPIPDPNYQGKVIRLEGDIPSPLEKPTGCPFHTRCPRLLGEICRTTVPPWQSSADGKQIYCHIPLDDLVADQGSMLAQAAGAGGEA